jgi:hypothetical protein
VEPVTEEALPLGFLRLGPFRRYGSNTGSLGAQSAVTGCNVEGKSADSEHN